MQDCNDHSTREFCCRTTTSTLQQQKKRLLSWSAVKVLITGAAGFIGSHVAEACVGDGHEVLALDDLSSGRRENVPAGAAFARVDIRDAEAVLRKVADFRPESLRSMSS